MNFDLKLDVRFFFFFFFLIFQSTNSKFTLNANLLCEFFEVQLNIVQFLPPIEKKKKEKNKKHVISLFIIIIVIKIK